MPGMMDTVLNLGLNDEVVKGLAKLQGDRFAYDCYRWARQSLPAWDDCLLCAMPVLWLPANKQYSMMRTAWTTKPSCCRAGQG